MNTKRIIGKILKAPLVLLGIAGIGASIYAAYNNIEGITYGTTVMFTIITIAYFVGFRMDKSTWMNQEEAVKEVVVEPDY